MNGTLTCRTVFFLLMMGVMLAGAAGFAAAAEEALGEVVYVEGGATLVRGEQRYPEIDFGKRVRNFDLIRTGSDGLVEVSLDPSTGLESVITVAPDTEFVFEMQGNESRRKSSLELFTGTVALNVQRLAGTADLEIRSAHTIMGVRGTSFDVSTAPAGELLVTCSTGRVACRFEDGRLLSAEPGNAVEASGDGTFRTIPVAAGDPAAFRRDWLAEKIRAFQANAGQAVSSYAKRYNRLVGQFNRAYQGLQEHAELLDKWIREEAQGERPGRIERMQEKKKIIGSLLEIRKVNFLFERVYYRVLELKSYYEQGYGREPVPGGVDAEVFFRKLERERGDLERKMNRVRMAMRLYARRNGGRFPLSGGVFLPEEEGEAGDREDSKEFFREEEEFF
ncbi:MAG: FecR family protein [Spirochaetales bacterium]|nr:FecR family protein [Spirochaetales bacterium]